jgi:hypothetical protein
MPQWEHRKIDLNNVPRKADDIDLLNEAGDQGWELVTISTNSIAYFKRQLEDPAPAPAARRKAATPRA